MIKHLLSLILVLNSALAEQWETGFKQMTGTQNVLVLRLQFPDFTSSQTYNDAATLLGKVATRLDQCSYHKLNITYDITPVLTLPEPTSYYNTILRSSYLKQETQLIADGTALAQAAGYDVSPTSYGVYDRVIYLFPNSNGAPFNIAQRYNHSVFSSRWIPTTLLHEMGHSWLFSHSGFWQVCDGNTFSPTGVYKEYGDPFDIMAQSYSPSYQSLDYCLYHKYWAGWVDDSQLITVNQPGTYTYTIYRYDNVNATGLLGVLVPDGNCTYWIAYRKSIALANGAYVQRNQTTPGKIVPTSALPMDGPPILLDANPATLTANDACLPIGRTMVDASNGISITTVAQGGTTPYEWLTIRLTRQ